MDVKYIVFFFDKYYIVVFILLFHRYGSSIIGSGAKFELGMRMSFYFSTGLSQM